LVEPAPAVASLPTKATDMAFADFKSASIET
jgi:hypothetical protein